LCRASTFEASEDVDGRDKPGHDEIQAAKSSFEATVASALR